MTTERARTHQSYDWSIPDDIRKRAFDYTHKRGTNTSWKVDNIARLMIENDLGADCTDEQIKHLIDNTEVEDD